MDSDIFPILIIFVMIVAGIVFRLIAGSFDRSRIEEYIRKRDGVLRRCDWHPFGKGWFGSQNERIYRITFTDRSGALHEATCKTSMLAGVYLTEDAMIQEGVGQLSELEMLRRDNALLRAELEAYKRQF